MQNKTITKLCLTIAFIPSAIIAWWCFSQMQLSMMSYVLSVAMFVFVWLFLFAIEMAIIMLCGYENNFNKKEE